MSVEQLRAVVAASRAAQGFPPIIEDPATLERVAAIFRLLADAKGKTVVKEPENAA